MALSLLSLLIATAPALAGSWHEDGEAGVRVRLPFPPGLIKTGRQVEALIGELEPDGVAANVTYTSGVYAPGGVPYFLIWKRADAAPPTRLELQRLSSDPEAGRPFGLVQLNFDRERLLGRGVAAAKPKTVATNKLERRVLFQLARGETIFLAYYFSQPQQAPWFEELVQSFELAPHKRLTPDMIPGGGLRLQEMLGLGVAGLMVLLGAVFAFAMQRSTRRAREAATVVATVAHERGREPIPEWDL